MRLALFGDDAGLVFDGLLFEMTERLADGEFHVGGLRQADNGAVAGADGDFCLMTVFFDSQDDLGFEFIA